MKRTLNLGCGNRVYAEYPQGYFCVNMDERASLTTVDVVGDVTNLELFNAGEFDYILASDILEHFPISRTASILTEWVRVLATGGLIEFRVPNLAEICKQYNGDNARHISWLLYGGQDYSGNFHYVCFDRKLLTEYCTNVGLLPIEYREEGTNFILLAKKQ